MGASQKIAIKFDRFLTIGIQPSLYLRHPCTIYEKGCKVRYSVNRMTE